MRTILSALAIGTLVACAGQTHTMKEQVKIPLVDAIALAQKDVPGQPIEATMTEVGDRYIYRIQILDDHDLTRWVLIDASDGRIIPQSRVKPPKF